MDATTEDRKREVSSQTENGENGAHFGAEGEDVLRVKETESMKNDA